jgi:branched-chain amino acid transport system ATP-binding protein
MTLMSVSDLHVAYGRVEALFGVSINIFAKQVVTVIGPNGAGKSTLLNAIIGSLPSRGSIVFEEKPIDQLEPEERVEQGICLVPEKRELFGSMTVQENLILGGYTRRREGPVSVRAALESVYGRFPRLKERCNQIAGTLSGGERQMLALGRALMSRPKILMLDEPSLGLAPKIVRDIFAIIAELRSTGVSILLVEQNARAALHVSDYCYVLENGALRMHGPSETLRKDERIVETYLGIKS